MFDELQREFSFWRWASQLAAAVCGPMIVFTILASVVELRDTLLAQLFSYAFVAALAMTLAIAIYAFAPVTAREGRWVWVIPAVLECLAIIWQISIGGIGSAWYVFFFVRGPGRGEASLGLLLTYPTWACCCYSAGMWWRRRATSKYVMHR